MIKRKKLITEAEFENIEAFKGWDTKDIEGFSSSSNPSGIDYSNTMFEDTFPTNLSEYKSMVGSGNGINFDFGIKMTYEVWNALVTYLNSQYKSFTMVTSSAWYEKSDANYIFEQFDDEIATTDEEGNLVNPLTEEVQEKIDGLINELIETL